MNVFVSIGRRGVSVGLMLATCASLAVATRAAAAGPASVVLPAMDVAAPHAAMTTVQQASVKPPVVVSEAAAALLVKQQATAAVAMPDDREIPFPRGWMLGLLAVLVLMLFDRIRLSMKLAKLNEDALQSSGLSAPFARN